MPSDNNNVLIYVYRKGGMEQRIAHLGPGAPIAMLYFDVAKLRCCNIALDTVRSCADRYYKLVVAISARARSSQRYIATIVERFNG